MLKTICTNTCGKFQYWIRIAGLALFHQTASKHLILKMSNFSRICMSLHQSRRIVAVSVDTPVYTKFKTGQSGRKVHLITVPVYWNYSGAYGAAHWLHH